MDKFGAISKVIVILLIALILCSCAMLLIDSAFNGTVGDWFVAHFIKYMLGKVMDALICIVVRVSIGNCNNFFIN